MALAVKNKYQQNRVDSRPNRARRATGLVLSALGALSLGACGITSLAKPANHRASAEVSTTVPTTEASVTTTTESPAQIANQEIQSAWSRMENVEPPGLVGVVAIPALGEEIGLVSITQQQAESGAVGDSSTSTFIDQQTKELSPQVAPSSVNSRAQALGEGTRDTVFWPGSGAPSEYLPVAGLWPGPAPGQIGNVTFFGHRTTRSAPFASIDQLAPGNNIYVGYEGKNYTYTVTGTQTIPAGNDEAIESYRYKDPPTDMQPEGYFLTMYACTPQKSNTDRFVVRAEQTAVNASPSGNQNTNYWPS